jgi:iron complex outermembrane receptor protein
VSVPIHKKTSETALPVTVLSGEALRRAVASNITETLNGMPGIASASFGPGLGRPVIRGQQGARAITLNNGIAATDVSSLSPDHAVSVEPMLAESIEVLYSKQTVF